jgi:MFS family permease
VSLTSFLMDISSEMVINIVPLFLSGVLGVKTNVIGLIEGVAEATASLLKVFSGWLSDRLGGRKWVAVAGYGLSAVAKPFFYWAGSWGAVAAVRWADRVGKGIRTAPRDALVADSIDEQHRGIAFGFHRAADTAGAAVGLLVAMLVVWLSQQSGEFSLGTFQAVVLVSVIPAFLAVLSLAVGAREVNIRGKRSAPQIRLKGLGKRFAVFLLLVGLFDLGNSSDAFLVLRVREAGTSVLGILGMVFVFNLVYTAVSAPAGALSDRIGRRALLISGWMVYALIYLGFALMQAPWQGWLLYAVYGAYYGLAYGTAKALVADVVPAQLRGTAYGTYSAVLGILDLPASVIAGVLWDGIGGFGGFGPAAPFLFGSATALLAAVGMMLWHGDRPAAGALDSAGRVSNGSNEP